MDAFVLRRMRMSDLLSPTAADCRRAVGSSSVLRLMTRMALEKFRPHRQAPKSMRIGAVREL
jgi:hypothetical protein